MGIYDEHVKTCIGSRIIAGASSAPRRRNMFKCEKCNEKLDDLSKFDQHQTQCGNIKKVFKCGKCGEKFGNTLEIENHILIAHSPDEENISKSKIRRKVKVVKQHSESDESNEDDGLNLPSMPDL